MKKFIFIIGLIAISCSSSNYIKFEHNGISFCDLKEINTIDFLNLPERKVTSEMVISSTQDQGWSTNWQDSDINISYCTDDLNLFYNEKALRILVSRSDWVKGYELSYDLYFNDQEILFAVEARHRFIDIYQK